jgi:hypothetical protein
MLYRGPFVFPLHSSSGRSDVVVDNVDDTARVEDADSNASAIRRAPSRLPPSVASRLRRGRSRSYRPENAAAHDRPP